MSKLVELKPMREKPSQWDKLEAAIKELLRREIYLPLLKILGEPATTITNARSFLQDAIRSGRITYHRGKFSGRFGSAISSELRELGARFNRRERVWELPKSLLPPEIVQAVEASESVFTGKVDRIKSKLTQILPEEIADKLNASPFFDKALWQADKDLKASMKAITVTPTLTDEARKKIADDWTTNMRLYIKDFTEKEIVKLRKDIEKRAMAGDRYQGAVKTIQESFGVSANKAKFLARQETNLLMAKFHQTRYEDAGVNEYRWACVKMPHDKNPSQHSPGNVRYSHGQLDGKVFRWSNPPITTEPGEPVRRNNPGQDYNCRCYAIPVVKFK